MLKTEQNLAQRSSQNAISAMPRDLEAAPAAERNETPKIQVKKNGQYLGTLLG
jgi:hypothetical protein